MADERAGSDPNEIDELLAMLIPEESGSESSSPTTETASHDDAAGRAGGPDEAPTDSATAAAPPVHEPEVEAPVPGSTAPQQQVEPAKYVPSAGGQVFRPVTQPATASWDGGSVGPGPDGVAPASPSKSRLPLLLVAGLVILAIGGGIGAYLGSGAGNEDTVAAGVGPEPVSDQSPAPTSGTTLPEEPTTTATTAAPTTSTTPPEEPFVGSPTPENPNGALAYGVFANNTISFRGVYPSQEVVDERLDSSALIVGEENVVFEGTIDPQATFDLNNFPVYLQNDILFKPAIADRSNDFQAVMDLGVAFMEANPDTIITIVARTDWLGTEETNLDLARERGQAMVDYLTDAGIDASRLTLDARGEQDAVQDATDDQASLDRRTEIRVGGTLG